MQLYDALLKEYNEYRKTKQGAKSADYDENEYKRQQGMVAKVDDDSLNVGLSVVKTNLSNKEKELNEVQSKRPGAKATIAKLENEVKYFKGQKKAIEEEIKKRSEKKPTPQQKPALKITDVKLSKDSLYINYQQGVTDGVTIEAKINEHIVKFPFNPKASWGSFYDRIDCNEAIIDGDRIRDIAKKGDRLKIGSHVLRSQPTSALGLGKFYSTAPIISVFEKTIQKMMDEDEFSEKFLEKIAPKKKPVEDKKPTEKKPAHQPKKMTIDDIPDAAFKRITSFLEKKDPDNNQAWRYLAEEEMDDNELAQFRTVAEYFRYGGKLNARTRENVKKWANLAAEEAAERRKRKESKA
jgi:hypothetical protein